MASILANENNPVQADNWWVCSIDSRIFARLQFSVIGTVSTLLSAFSMIDTVCMPLPTIHLPLNCDTKLEQNSKNGWENIKFHFYTRTIFQAHAYVVFSEGTLVTFLVVCFLSLIHI